MRVLYTRSGRCYLDSSTSAVSFPQRVIVWRARSKEEEIPLPRFLSVIAAFLPAQWRVKQSSTLFLIASLLSYRVEISCMKALPKLHKILYYCTLRYVRDASAIFIIDESSCALYKPAFKDIHHGLRDATWLTETQLVISSNRRSIFLSFSLSLIEYYTY